MQLQLIECFGMQTFANSETLVYLRLRNSCKIRIPIKKQPVKTTPFHPYKLHAFPPINAPREPPVK